MHPRWASQKMPALYGAVIGITATNAVVSWLGTSTASAASGASFRITDHCELHISLAHLNTSLTTWQCCEVLMCSVTINRIHSWKYVRCTLDYQMAGCELRLMVSTVLTPQPTINISQVLEVKSKIPQWYDITFFHTHTRKKEGKGGKSRDMANMYEEALNSVSEPQKN